MTKFFKNLKNKIKSKFGKKPSKNINERKPEYVSESLVREIVRELLVFDTNNYLHLIDYNSSTKFWGDFICALIYCESNFNKNSIYMEPAPLYYESIGLLQLSYNDMKYYKFNDISGEKIFDEVSNIEFGMRIMNHLVSKNKTPIFNSGNYWSVLMPKNTAKHIKFLKKLNEYQKEGV